MFGKYPYQFLETCLLLCAKRYICDCVVVVVVVVVVVDVVVDDDDDDDIDFL